MLQSSSLDNQADIVFLTEEAVSSVGMHLPDILYVLTFSRGRTKVATATVDARGCGVFTIKHLDGSTVFVFWADAHEQCFWDYLHTLVNAPEPINFDTGTLCSAGSAFRPASSPNWTEY